MKIDAIDLIWTLVKASAFMFLLFTECNQVQGDW